MLVFLCPFLSLWLSLSATPLITGDDEVIRWETSWPNVTLSDAGLEMLPSVRHQTLFEGSAEMGMYNHGPLICDDNGTLLVSWFSHEQYEGAAGTRILYCCSTNGESWSEPQMLFDSIGPMAEKGELGTVLSPQWYTINGRIYAAARLKKITAWEKSGTSISPVYENVRWIVRPVQDGGIVASNCYWLASTVPEGYEAENIRPYRFAADETVREDLADLQVWISERGQRYSIPKPVDGAANLCEASYFFRPDGTEVGVYRDANNSLRLYSSVRDVVTQTWKQALKTNIPDSSSKTTSGTLPDGTAYMIGNFLHQLWLRDPLMIALSSDGIHFNRAYVIRRGAEECREKIPGDFKGPGYQYPNACISGTNLWVTYSIGKEQIAASAIPLDDLGL
jgi:hypothetical protein